MNFFDVYLPIAGIHFNLLILIAIGFCVGVMGGFFGLGLGFITNTALNIFGFHMAFAIGTGLSNVFGQSLSAIRKHNKMGTIDWKLGPIAIATSLVGFEIGSRVVIALQNAGDAGEVIRWAYVVFLGGLGAFMFYDYFVLQKKQLTAKAGETALQTSEASSNRIAEKLHNIRIPPMISFPISRIDRVSLWVIIGIFLFTGFLSGVLGIGGGFMVLPALVYLVGLPTTLAVGTTLITVVATAAFGCLTYSLDGRVEVFAAVFLLLGSSVGAQVGATAIRFIRGYGIRLLFAVMIVLAGLSVVFEQFYKMTHNQLLHDCSGVVLLGTGLALCMTIIVRLTIGAVKENVGKV